ncbi:MAG: pentapeptide repeat-containing protein [Candidatus Eremiobacteraeota bacterium]|nr:pentapeptide repeat-containing protein [Candidatus Eremiobacteraeota bacterium]MBV8655035.1 pentapeptide repeat-containing protein [Candidatus Eremiobacteraeota bacterium]
MPAALTNDFIAVAAPIAAIVVNALWEGALLVAGVWLVIRALPRLNASTRYAIWSATLAAIVIVPIATTLPFLTTTAVAQTSSSAVKPPATERPVGAPMVTHALTSSVSHASTPVQSSPAVPPRFHVTMSVPVAIGIFAAWGLLALVSIVRLAIGLTRLEQLKRDALPLPVEYRDAMVRWTQANKGSREVRLCVSDETDVPVAVGLFDSMILIPRALLERLSENEVDQISLHELAHLRRADDWTNGFQRIAVALLAWNPAALFVSQQLDLEREVACDDWVLSLTGTVRPYALCLTKMAETSSWPRQPMPAPGVFATRKHISLRIERLLGAGRNIATTLSLGPTALAIAVVATLSLAIAAVAPSVAAPCLQVFVPAPPQIAIPAVPAIATIPTPKEKIIVLREAVPAAASAAGAASAAAASAPARAASVAAVPAIPPMPHMPAHVAGTIHVPQIDVHVPAVDVHVPPMDVHVPGMTVPMPPVPSMPSTHSMVAQNVHQCSGCNFSGVNWSGKDMRGAQLSSSDFSHANLENVDFSDANVTGVDFSGANLHGAHFRNARMSGCDFSNANLTGVDFAGARMSGCQFTGASMSSPELRTVLESCTGCDFSRATLAGADMSNIKTSGIDFSRANLNGANLSGSVFTGVDFSHATMNGAHLDGATFSGCDLSGVDLTHVDLTHVKMIGTDFSSGSSESSESPKP